MWGGRDDACPCDEDAEMSFESDSTVEIPYQDRLPAAGLSYKFQRLRERIRAAVASGELHGKLPGERALAKRFNVNAKTLSKALTDLAAEGLLDRSIGRGTYVKGSAPTVELKTGRWLVFCTPDQVGTPILSKLKASNPDLHVHSERQWDLRPSFLQPFSKVISLDPGVPETLLRNLVVRNMNVVTVDYQPKVFSMHSVLDDTFTCAANLTRTLMMEGHRSFIVVERRGQDTIAKAVRQTARRLSPDATVDVVDPADVAAGAFTGVTFICESQDVAMTVSASFGETTVASVWAVGCAEGQVNVGGVYTDQKQKIDAIVTLLNEPPSRPTATWLAGEFVPTASARVMGATQVGATLQRPGIALAS
jgi:hypothetical protein